MNSLRISLKAIPVFLKNLAGIPTPILWANKITYRCNCQCGFCPCWKMDSSNELSTGEAIELIRQAGNLGVIFNAFEGGEPLLREDLPLLLKESKKQGMVNTIITNGILLSERFDEIEEWTDCIVVSIDGPKKIHDRLRKTKAFDKAIEGARLAIGRTRVFFNCVITKENSGHLGEVIDLAEDLGTKVSFCPVVDFEGCDSLAPSKEELQVIMSDLFEMKKEGRPIFNSLPYLKAVRDGKRFECKTGEVFLHTDPAGNLVLPCFCWKKKVEPFAPAKNGNLKKAWVSEEARKIRQESKKCTTCNFIDCFETSMLFSGRIDIFLSMYHQWNDLRG